MKHTPGPWIVDNGMVTMDDQAQQLKEDIGTERQWVAIGIEDEEGFSEVVALAHPSNAHLIATAPNLLEACEIAKSTLDYAYFQKGVACLKELQFVESVIQKAKGGT